MTGWGTNTGWGMTMMGPPFDLRARPFGEVGFDDVAGREDGVNIDRRRPDHEGECGLERRGFGKARPFDRIAHVAISRNADDLAGLVVHAAIVSLVTDLNGAFDEQQPGQAAGLNISIEDGAAHRDRSCRRANDVSRFGGNASDEPKGSLDEIEDDGAAGYVGIVDELVEHQSGARPQRQLSVVSQPELARAFRADLDQLVLADVVACCETARVSLVRRRDKVDDPDGRANVIARRGNCLRHVRQNRYNCEKNDKKPIAHLDLLPARLA